MTTLNAYFQPLATVEQFRRLFRELPAPLIFAGLGHCNALTLQRQANRWPSLNAAPAGPEANPSPANPGNPAGLGHPAFPLPLPRAEEVRAAMGLAASVWLAAGAFAAVTPERLAAAVGKPAPAALANPEALQ